MSQFLYTSQFFSELRIPSTTNAPIQAPAVKSESSKEIFRISETLERPAIGSIHLLKSFVRKSNSSIICQTAGTWWVCAWLDSVVWDCSPNSSKLRQRLQPRCPRVRQRSADRKCLEGSWKELWRNISHPVNFYLQVLELSHRRMSASSNEMSISNGMSNEM